jgi:hypothetical protein
MASLITVLDFSMYGSLPLSNVQRNFLENTTEIVEEAVSSLQQAVLEKTVQHESLQVPKTEEFVKEIYEGKIDFYIPENRN